MRECTLVCHPLTPCGAITAIAVEVARSGLERVVLRYVATGAIDKVVLPRMTTPARRDNLWQHTCFEAFVQPKGGRAYSEFNFSPSLSWAAYAFDDTRTGMRPLEGIEDLRIEIDGSASRYQLTATLDLPGDAPWKVGLSAIIEETGSRKSYWALAHPGPKPDFHRADCFTLELA
jgi:hypothetical protein